jgi:hypothetical protein
MLEPSLNLSYSPPGPSFPISEQCEMPEIQMTANVAGVDIPAGSSLQYCWTVSLVFSGANCPHSRGRVIKHPDINVVTTGNQFKIPFTQIRGGDLSVSVTVTIGSITLTAQSKGLQVTGTNPPMAALAAFVPKDVTFRKLMCHESGLKQFLSPTCPYFSRDNLGGVGICQVTDSPTDDQVWSWKENINAGWKIYQDKQKIARSYAARMRASTSFQALVKAYNDARLKQTGGQAQTNAAQPQTALTPLVIELPDYSDEQLQWDTVRGYNGYCAGVHEYRVKTDSSGMLVVIWDEANSKATAQWEQISAEQRIERYKAANIPSSRWGDPFYVRNVQGHQEF